MTSPVNCPKCSAALPKNASVCPYCSAQFEKAPLTPEVRGACVALIRSANKSLADVSSRRLLLSLLLGVIAAPALLFFLARTLGAGLITASVLACAALLAGLLIVGFMVPAEEDKKFNDELKPRILAFAAKNEVSVEEFLAIAKQELKENAPLLRQLDKLGEA